ncbi:enolase superfamily protein [Citrifermentans bemidjiense Bem]|uniref:Enolase superfamily protein n=1 Tax=Citrifermentans bemidjiense (strain ATCC BAA-1014 / DSM 16622 / JCM 12645 / Bem) TaxID=404380 RepID=B5EA21_CITBB|nr:enolase C-terminal domain-like protein [Citrifermentans bemidjiense]ACH37319.1 enolase superfamily protein [Citrifermentans bemidjiense Bem]
MAADAKIEQVEAQAYRIPTEDPESDGSYRWTSTTLVTVHIQGGGARGFGYSYADAAAATLITGKLAQIISGRNPVDIPCCWRLMLDGVRNLGEPGIAMLAISAVDAALWDLKGKLLELSVVDLLGVAREAVTAAGVSWFEEPVVHHDLEGLRILRDRTPAGMEIAAGEYGFTLPYFRRMLQAGAVDVLQADATRCGITGFLQAATLCESHHLQLSAHCAPSLHIHPCCAAPTLRHLEYFHDHARIESMLFDGFIQPVEGKLAPDRSRPGLGIELREGEASHFRF